jgi:hypothetical protein
LIRRPTALLISAASYNPKNQSLASPKSFET